MRIAVTRARGLLLAVFCVGTAQGADLSLNGDWRVVATEADTILALHKDGRQAGLWRAPKLTGGRSVAKGSALVSGGTLSANGRIALLNEAAPNGASLLRAYDSLSGKGLFQTRPVSNVLRSFWLNECHYGLLFQQAGEPVLKVFQVNLEAQKKLGFACQPFRESQKIPRGESPVAFLTDRNFNHYGFYANGARENLAWIGRGGFQGFQGGAKPHFWFFGPEGESSETLFRARTDTHKIQPVATSVRSVTSPKEGKGVFIVRQDGALVALEPSAATTYRERVLAAQHVERAWTPASGKWVLYQSVNGTYGLVAAPF